MRIIKEVTKRIKEELKDAQWYAKEALEHKANAPDVAEAYNHLAREEMSHATLLHEKVVALIKRAEMEKAPPPVMRELWAWQHEEIIEDQVETKRLIEMYATMK